MKFEKRDSLVEEEFRKHSRETRRAFRILIVGKFLIYKKKKKQERENAAGIDSGKCLIYAFRLKKKNEIFDRGRDDDIDGEYEKKKKRVRKRASESERERKRD